MNRDGITPRYTSYYKPRGAVNVTETEKIGDRTVVAKFQVAPEKSNYKVFPYGPSDSSVTPEPYNPTPYKPPHALDQLAQPYQPLHALDQLAQPYRPPHALDQLAQPYQPLHALDQLAQRYRPPHALDQLARPFQPPSPTSYNRGGVDRHLGSFQLRTHPALRPRRTEDEGREEEVWEFYKKLREAGYSEEDAAKATAIFLSGGDVYTGLLGEDY